MSESALHLKLDRILTGQAQILARITEQDETTAILTAAMATLNDFDRDPDGSHQPTGRSVERGIW